MRIEWIDAAKGLGIIFVILGHTDVLFRPYIYSFHMPLFFFLSGFLSHNSSMKFFSFLIKKIRTLLIPYGFFAIVSLLMNTFVMNTEVDLSVYFRELLMVSRSGVSINPTLWFLPCLFAVEIMNYLLNRLIRHPTLVQMVAIGLSAISFASVSKILLPFSVNDAAFNLVFYTIGKNSRGLNWDHYIAKAVTGVCCFLAMILFVKPSLYAILLQQIPGNKVGQYVGTVLVALIGILGIIYLSNALKNCVRLKFWGKNSLIIFTTHVFILRGIFYLLIALGLHVEQSYHIYSVCATMICLGIMTPFIRFFNEFFSGYLGR